VAGKREEVMGEYRRWWEKVYGDGRKNEWKI
jgi:hypothetical protein